MSKIITVPFGWLLGQLYALTDNYGVAMIIFALFVQVILIPMNAKSKQNIVCTLVICGELTCKEIISRVKVCRGIFTDNGFTIVYDRDVTREVGDGFFFTIGYPGIKSGELLKELLYYGVSSISLSTTGSEEEGVRACTSRMREELYPVLEERMRNFKKDHPVD